MTDRAKAYFYRWAWAAHTIDWDKLPEETRLYWELQEIISRNAGRTHWDGCEESHPDCKRVKEIEALLADPAPPVDPRLKPSSVPGTRR